MERILEEKTDKEIKILAAKAIENFIFWSAFGNKGEIEKADKIFVIVFKEIGKRKL